MGSRKRLYNTVKYGLIVIVAVGATLLGTSNGRIIGITPIPKATPMPSATPLNPVDAQPAPVLFKPEDLLPISSLLTTQFQRAETNIKGFYADQPTGSTVDDRAFAAWASKQITIEPSAGARAVERAEVLDFNRSAKRDTSARWLGLHGCRDVWASYVLEQERFQGADDQVATIAELGTVLDLAARVAQASQKRFASDRTATAQAPCAPSTAAVRDPCGCSFPSTTAAMSAAARIYLAGLEPRVSRQYAWMERQVDLAPVYQGLELPSDTGAGAYLGYLVGRYFLASRGYPALPTTPPPTPTR